MEQGYLTLNNGVKMPQLGFGTIGQSGDQIVENVAFALNNGYRLIDTANRYGNETEVGEGLKKSGLNREEYFLETKLGPTLYENDRHRFSVILAQHLRRCPGRAGPVLWKGESGRALWKNFIFPLPGRGSGEMDAGGGRVHHEPLCEIVRHELRRNGYGQERGGGAGEESLK